MSDGRDAMNARIDAYLDGGFSSSERAAIDARTDAAIASELDLQHRIDERLRVIMAAPDAPDASAAVVESQPTIAGRVGRRWMLAAAALLLCAIGAWAAIAQPWHAWLKPAPSALAANAAFDRLVKGGFTPDWVCENDEVFKKYTAEKLGNTFTIKPASNVQVVGWTYMTGLLENEAQVLLAKADGQPVVLVMGKKSEDRTMHVDAGSPLRLHRRELWDLVMYEVSAREDAAVLPNIRGPGCAD